MKYNTSGQALVILLVYMVIAMITTSMAVALVIINATSTSHVEQGDMALNTAESGAENALIRLIRTPNYTGETLTVGGGSATVTVSGSSDKTILSEGVIGGYERNVQVVVRFLGGVMTILSWQEL